MLPRWILLLLCALIPRIAHTADRPALVVVFSIDQMREDYFERFHTEFTGGFGRLYREGVFYSGATLNYAASETGPGHATMLSGQYPAHSGIVGNEWIDPRTRRRVYCVEDSAALPIAGEGGYRSPRNLLTTSLGDWLKAASPASMVISISAKDRAAILMGGQKPDWAFWYQSSAGDMVSSSYYGSELPGWVVRFNKSNWVAHHAPASWVKLSGEPRYDEPDDFPAEASPRTFPHVFKHPSSDILTSPWGDFLLLDFAEEAIRAERLGQRGVSDLLCISLSATDYIGHSFGPNSQEMHDHLLRLDRKLGEFISTLERTLGREKVVIALTADHGVLPLPEYLSEHGEPRARRIDYNTFKARVGELDSTLQTEFGSTGPVIQQLSFLDYNAAAAHGVDSTTLEHRIREGLLGIDGVADVYFRRELFSPSPDVGSHPFIDRFVRSFYSPRSEDVQLRFCEWCLISSHTTGTSHGSPYSYDTHVPVVFLAKKLAHARIARPVHTVDLAPTLGVILHAVIPPTVDGLPLLEVLEQK
jgi:predicted AlkP superfamily pyrophosphatase or phosphodiesterase